MTTLNLMGAGRVGRTLASLWARHGVFEIQDVLTSSLTSAQEACTAIGAGTAVATIQGMRPADVWMVAVQDARIAEVAHALAATHASGSSRPIVFHCSGAQNSSSLQPLAELGWRTASAHCILSFSNVAAAVQQFAGTACALEGDASACETMRAAFESIGAQTFGVASEDKVLYHAAAVFATNFLPVLQSVAEAAWTRSGVPPELIPHLRATLLRNAADNITRQGPAGALTGPAARGDVAAIARQADVVQAWDAPSGDAYRALSTLALRLAGH
ncbi:Rossmann-like and DUF2520 domain-containing protein [Rhodoferax mekongensis]|uniref:Rossmann-like and DUF2520 domain-containing protein n=1 Tax=Rhodoferax mekongensis TaxID=3068341 RepID=UPI0028BDBCF9|nr:Rossmann-like and DUF2520 domain-containing protein [Rhodoferax sp. TBRC 17199]MDT7516946.1 DUF2520 domain-containing protein [Rhodoferax sp. TBRC 17199]